MEKYTEKFEALVREQLERALAMEKAKAASDYAKMDKIVIGFISGDGIGPIISKATKKVLTKLLADELAGGKVEFRNIEGLTLENRIAKGETLPAEVLAEIKACDLLIKGPTTTPDKKSGINLESANVALRRELDLYANVRPVKIPERGIDWIFFRENTEGEYALGSRGVEIKADGSLAENGEESELAFDFKVTTNAGTRHIAKAAFDYAQANGKQNVSIITKANILKKTDGKFLEICYEVAKEYPDIMVDDWYVDITAANLVNEEIGKKLHVFILPNLYGDIITDEAAQIQGGVGTAGSANIGSKYAMFEAIHGSAPRLMKEGKGELANPESLLTAAVMMLRHIGMSEKAAKLEKAIAKAESNLNMSCEEGANTCDDFAEFIIKELEK